MVDSLSVLSRVMDFQSAMETFAEAWVAANVTQVNINSKQIVNFCEKCTHWTISKDMKQTKKRIKNKRCRKLSKIYLSCPFTPETAIYGKRKFREVQH